MFCMSSPDLSPIYIPKILHNSDTGEPFQQCLVCSKLLLIDATSYFIEKAVRQVPEMNVTEVIFEYALCQECMVKMNATLSVESRERIGQYFVKHVDFSARRTQLLESKNFSIRAWISHCVIKGTPIENTREYQIVAQCDGKHLLFGYAPFALSLEAMEEITGLMSAQSLGEIDNFMGKYFSGPPEVAELLKRRLIIL